MRRETVVINNEAYQLLSYLESTTSGTNGSDQNAQYIDTGIVIPDNYVKLECEVMFVDSNKNKGDGIIGGRDNSDGFVCAWGYYNKMRFYNGTKAIDVGTTIYNNTLYNIVYEQNGTSYSYKCNNTPYSGTQSGLTPLTSIRTLYMFCAHRVNDVITNVSKLRIYWLKLYTSQGLVLDMVPRLRTADSKPGYLNLVNNQFYTQGNPNANEFNYA